MKNLFLAAGLALVATACMPTDDNRANQERMENADSLEAVQEVVSENEDLDPSTCAQNYPIRVEALNLWQSNWSALQSMISKRTNIHLFDVDSLSLDKSTFNTLLNECGDCDGVRVYFGLKEELNLKTPVLILVNNQECNDVLGANNQVLLLDPTEAPTFVAYTEVTPYMDAWREVLPQIIGEIPALVNIAGYTFSRSALNSQLNNPNATGMNLHFGLRTVSLSDTEFDVDNNGSSCTDNAPYQGQLVMNLVSQYTFADSDSSTVACARMDYANPCPQHCGISFYAPLND